MVLWEMNRMVRVIRLVVLVEEVEIIITTLISQGQEVTMEVVKLKEVKVLEVILNIQYGRQIMFCKIIGTVLCLSSIAVEVV